MPLFNTPLQPVTLLDPTKKEIHSMKHGVIDLLWACCFMFAQHPARPSVCSSPSVSLCPLSKEIHGQAVKKIIRYLVKTRDRGLEFVPNLEEGLDCYVDADFAGLWGHEDDQDPVSVRSRTGFTLTLFGCPILWSRKLQTDQTLSSTAAEYVAFSMAMRHLHLQESAMLASFS